MEENLKRQLFGTYDRHGFNYYDVYN
jgi:hypothetical protein